MTWNYRVLLLDAPGGDAEYVICEAYYDKRATRPHGHTGAVNPVGGSVKELRKELKRMLKATKKPIVSH